MPSKAKGGVDSDWSSTFAPEFHAIDLYRSSEGHTVADVAPELAIDTETFPKWVDI